MLEFHDVTKVYRRGFELHTALKATTLTLKQSMRLGVIGESGSGKSTLIRLALGIETPSTGQVVFRGHDIQSFSAKQWSQYRRNVQWIGQDTGAAFNPRWTIRKSLMRVNATLCELKPKEALKRIESLTSQMNLDASLLDRKPAALSGGQRQRFSIVRAVMPEPEVLLADEAVSALDVSVQASVLNLMKDYCESSGCALLFVSHGLPATGFMSDQIVVMKDGEMVESGTSREVLERPQNDYTRLLVNAYTYDQKLQF